MIIVLSGWRGTSTVDCQVEISDATADILRRLFIHFPDARYRVGNNPAGFDSAVNALWIKQRYRAGWYWPQVFGRRSLDRTWVAEWNKHGKAAGPLRNLAMMRGDGTADDTHGFAHLLVAMPEPGRRRPHSGTWDTIDAAAECGVDTLIVPLRPARLPFGQLDRMPGFPLPPR